MPARNKRAGGRPPYGRLTFQRFPGLSLKDSVPDAETMCAFKETLAKKGAAEELNALFTKRLEKEGIITHSESIIDATFVGLCILELFGNFSFRTTSAKEKWEIQAIERL
jgi:transposase